MEKNTFVRRTGSGIWDSRGEVGRTMIRDNPLGSCVGFRSRHSAVHIRRLGGVDWAEIGWRKIDRLPAQGGPYWVGFVEWGRNLETVEVYAEFGWNCGLSSQLSPNHVGRFKIFHLSGGSGTDWRLDYDDDNNGSYCTVLFFLATSFGQGLATGETGVFGGDDTNAYDHFTHMNYSNLHDNTGWTLWPANTFYQNCIPGWGRRWISGSEWDLLQGNPCPG
ncbi:MAG: hypothetical protein ACREV8_00175 [Gammaproteobacteria bacterium]